MAEARIFRDAYVTAAKHILKDGPSIVHNIVEDFISNGKEEFFESKTQEVEFSKVY